MHVHAFKAFSCVPFRTFCYCIFLIVGVFFFFGKIHNVHLLWSKFYCGEILSVLECLLHRDGTIYIINVYVFLRANTLASVASKHRGCINKAKSFCYLCGDYTTVAQHKTITALLKTFYIILTLKLDSPHVCCKPCYNVLTA